MSDLSTGSQPASKDTSTGKSRTAASDDGLLAAPKLTGAALWVAIFAIVVWIGFSIFLIVKAGTNETEWTRIAWVFGSIQAIAFAAAGALFGTAVQQRNVDNAQQQAVSAKKDADQQRETAANGRALAAVVQAGATTHATSGASGVQRAAVSSPPGTGPADELLQRYAQLSRALFGELI
jgi:hypothetical protein